MEIGPILRAMGRNKVKVGLLVLEIAFTTVVVLNCLSILIDQRRDMLQPNGIDEENIIAVSYRSFGSGFSEAEYRSQVASADLELLRSLPDVRAVAAIAPFPLQGGGSSFQVRPMGAPPSALVRSPQYFADEHFIEALGLELIEGRAFTGEDLPVGDGPRIFNIIVTKALADALYPDGDAVGQTVDTGSAEWPDVIVGVIAKMHTPYGGGPMEDRITFYPGRPTSSYVVRTEAGELTNVFGGIAGALESLNAERVVRARTLLELKAGGYAMNVVAVKVLGAIIALLLVVTSLGIFGVTSFAVAQRTRQIGTRRALGAERWQIVRYFLVENSMIALLGIGLGLVGAVALNQVLVARMDTPPLGGRLMVAGVALLWVVGIAATVWPARRAALIPPALATRTA